MAPDQIGSTLREFSGCGQWATEPRRWADQHRTVFSGQQQVQPAACVQGTHQFVLEALDPGPGQLGTQHADSAPGTLDQRHRQVDESLPLVVCRLAQQGVRHLRQMNISQERPGTPLLEPRAGRNILAFQHAAGSSRDTSLLVSHAQPGVLRELRLHGIEMAPKCLVAAVAGGDDLCRRGLHDGASCLQVHRQRVVDLCRELRQQTFAVGAHTAFGFARCQIGGHQSGQGHDGEHRPADCRRQMQSRIQPLPQAHDTVPAAHDHGGAVCSAGHSIVPLVTVRRPGGSDKLPFMRFSSLSELNTAVLGIVRPGHGHPAEQFDRGIQP